MAKKRLPKSIRKHIRDEKARIRKAISNPDEQYRAILALYEKFKIGYNKK
ncbi:MAG: hypothetical protein HYT34_01585 [Candidatus Ryanbacteria bacterium]|nr:hypothetical protein [Candidatus Ryanbacteria bacterium]